MFDILIIGAGPAGIFCAQEIVRLSPKTSVCLIDMGNRVENRKPNEVMSGFGGAGTYSDGKLHFTPKLSHERVFHIIKPDDYQVILDEIDSIFMGYGVTSKEYPDNMASIQHLIDDAQNNDIELVVRRAKHVGTDVLGLVIKKMQDFLEDSGVNIMCNVEVSDLIVENNVCVGVLTSDKKKIFAKKVLCSPGRVNASWLQKLGTSHGFEYVYDMVEVGVRVEFPASVMKKHADALYEIVFKVRTPTFDDIMRTFCSCPNGMVATETYDGYVCVNGHSNSAHTSPNSNFAFVCEVNLTEPVENTIAYAKSIAELASTIGGGKPIIQRLADLKMGRRSTWIRIEKSLVNPSLKNVTPGDISMALPYRIVQNIIEGLEKLDKIMPGINSGSTLLYAPEVKFRSSKVKTTKDMQTTVKNLYVAGDASGLSGTITGAAATGIMAARGMLKKS